MKKSLMIIGGIATAAIGANVAMRSIAKSGGSAKGALLLAAGPVMSAVTPFWIGTRREATQTTA